ncbi:MAG: CBS domain-containing protein [Lachnospiraceae bacterium]|nr:CBS domain-containing protein [Lachnospiraceae bacterium]
MNVLMFLKDKKQVAYLYDTNTLRQGLKKMKAHGYTAIPVLRRDGTYAGSVSEGDFLRYILDHSCEDIREQEAALIQDIIRPDFIQPVKINASMEYLFQCSMNQNFIPVTDDRNFFIGIVTRQDIIRGFLKERQGDKI